jgi:cystathionine gamma-lyase
VSGDWSPDEFGFETRAIHAGQAADPSTGAVVTPLYLTSTYVHSAPGVHQGYDYSRSGNPTRRAFEDCVANLEGARFGFAMASGSVGTATIVHLLDAGDHVVACDDMYGGTYRQFERVFVRSGIEFSYVDMTDAVALANAIKKNTRLVWVETPSNPLLKVVDVARCADVAHAAGALLAVDNTFMSPYFQRPIALGADLVMHSTTKYINGHSDLIGGVVITNDEALAEKLAFLSNALGGIQSAFDAYLCLRSLKTLAVRMRAHAANALAVARFLEGHRKIESVRYTGLASHPQHALANKQMTGHGGMLVCNVRGDLEATRRFLLGARVFALAESLGGVESLIEHPAIMTHASLPPSVRQSLGIGDNLVRISVGIESQADLIADLDRALAAV